MAFYETQILDYLNAHRTEIFEDLLKLVKAQSPTRNLALTSQCTTTLRELVKARLGLEPQVFSQPDAADHLQFTYGTQAEQILLVGHYDTIWEADQIPLRETDDEIYGPGIFDMKAGVIAHIWAVKACKELDIPLDKKLVLFFNSDEETGSHTSRAPIEQLARQSAAAIVTEATEAVTGNIKCARKGVRFYSLEITGKASHAGNDPFGGASAINEAAHQILAIHALTDKVSGTTLNVGVIHGGTRPNIIADHVHLEIDLRTATMAEAERVHQQILNLKPNDPRCTLQLDYSDPGRPPLENNAANQRLYEVAKDCASRLGFALGKTAVGGGSDGNFTSAVGCPTLDGMGAVGDGPHAIHEHIKKEPYLTRIALLAATITQL